MELLFAKKFEAIKQRLHLNIKSGHVMIDVKDRDWLLSVIEIQFEKERKQK